MGTISVTLPSDGDTIDAADVNNPINTIVGVINGNIDNNNIASGGVATANLATGIQVVGKESNPYKFSVYRNTDQTVTASTEIKVQLNAENFDTNSNFDSSTNYRYTAPVNGFYFFSGHATNNGNGDFYVVLYKNGSAFRNGTRTTIATGLTAGVVTELIQLSATDYIELFVYSGNTTIVGGAGSTYLSGFLVSAT